MNHPHFPLEPDRNEMARLGRLTLERTISFVDELPNRPAYSSGGPAETELVREFLVPPPEEGRQLPDLLEQLDAATDHGLGTAGPGYLCRVPSGGVYTSALADLYKASINRSSSFAAPAPLLTALKESVVRWIAREVIGFPTSSGALITPGESMANLSGVVAARHARLGDEITDGVLYVSDQTHHSVVKAAWLARIPRRNVRVVTADLRLDVAAAAAMITEDRRAGMRPFMLAAAAGTTDTGAVPVSTGRSA
jgi:aromatic-L-amino-acid decarboxylase